MVEDQKPGFGTQVSSLSDRDATGLTSPNTPGTLTGKRVVLVSDKNGVAQGPTETGPPLSEESQSVAGTSVKTSITFSGQSGLAPLPIPSLEFTMLKFLKSIEAFDDDREKSKEIADEFLFQDGPKLQKLLVEYDRKGRESGEIGSYVEEFWNDSYLAPDSSVVLNLNPFFVLVSCMAMRASTSPNLVAINSLFFLIIAGG